MGKYRGRKPDPDYFLDTKLQDRFWCKVDIRDEDECWEWQAAKFDDRGYGAFQVKDYALRAPRVAWCISNQEAIPEDKVVLHSCDNPPCVNPKHLSIGTTMENHHDAISKKRHVSGRLSEEQRLEIARLYDTGSYTQKEIGEIYGVRADWVCRIYQSRKERI